MAYIFNQDELPKLVSAGCGRERVSFVNQELAGTDDMLAGVMRYQEGAVSPYHMHRNCEHFYFIIEGSAKVDTAEGSRNVKPGDLAFFQPEDEHRLSSPDGPLFYLEFQAPNRFQTVLLDGVDDDPRWERVDGKIWVQS